MLKDYLKMAVRSLQRHPYCSVISVLSLFVGLAAVFFIFLFIRDELLRSE